MPLKSHRLNWYREKAVQYKKKKQGWCTSDLLSH